MHPDSAIAFVCATCQCNGSEAANLDIQQLWGPIGRTFSTSELSTMTLG